METLTELLAKQWNNDQKMVDHCLKNSLYIQSGDTFISVGSRKPGIQSDMWYDDETTGPDENFENFKAYNMQSNAQPMLKKVTEFGSPREIRVIPNYYNDKTQGKLACLIVRQVDAYEANAGRPATDEEIKMANEAREQANADYEKRLVSYWKRYSNKVRARGYYANR